jgi:hypothetical protein
MPNSWSFLRKKDPEDRNLLAEDEYTMLEKYLNGLI